jgi:Xaa-Pro aminopeptidase
MLRLPVIQNALNACRLDGWLLYNFRGSNPIASGLLSLPEYVSQSRRYFYFIPAIGQPHKLVHRIESSTLDSLEGETSVYSGWREMEQALAHILQPYHTIAMEYSPRNAIPYIACVDAGTIELVKSTGVNVASSADLVQYCYARWTPEQFAGHCDTGERLITAVHKAFGFIATQVNQGVRCTEWDVQQFLLNEFCSHNLVCAEPPNCSVNQHSADPHYMAIPESALDIQEGDFVLIDLYAKQASPGAVYADYTWTGYVGKSVPEKYAQIFDVVRTARDRVVEFLQTRLAANEAVYGWEADDVCRNVIAEHGYGDLFVHRTGHSIGEEVHGWGANLDHLETRDERQLIPETGFSIEPGIYFPGDFGVRSEINAFITSDNTLRITGTPVQTEILPLLASFQ